MVIFIKQIILLSSNGEGNNMKLGNQTIPDSRLPDLVDVVKTIYGKFGSKPIDHETISRLLGHSTSRSGAYRQKIADLRAFNLVESRGDVKITDTGRKVSYPNNRKEEQEGLLEAIKSIELWRNIYQKYTEKNVSLPSDFWTDIREWTGLPPEEAQNGAEIARKAYLEDIKYIKPEFEAENGEDKMGTGTIDTSKAISEGVMARFTLKDIGYVDVKDKDTYQIAKAYLKVLAKKLGLSEEEG